MMLKSLLLYSSVAMSGLPTPDSQACMWMYEEAYLTYYHKLDQSVTYREALEKAESTQATVYRDLLVAMTIAAYEQEPVYYSEVLWQPYSDEFAHKWVRRCRDIWRVRG